MTHGARIQARGRVPIRARPFLKWAGGKGQLVERLAAHMPEKYSVYYEPFLGGGALFFHVRPVLAALSDINSELMNTYRVVRDDVEKLIAALSIHKNTKEWYYMVRSQEPDKLDDVSRAARFIYLNKTGYNGLHRVNKKGKFNVPYGRYANPDWVNADGLRAASSVLQGATIVAQDFAQAVSACKEGDFVYFDPPYDPVSDTAKFVSYSGQFGREDQARLAQVFRALVARGCYVMESNSDTPFIRELYEGFRIETVRARRAINCRADGRGPVRELVIIGY